MTETAETAPAPPRCSYTPEELETAIGWFRTPLDDSDQKVGSRKVAELAEKAAAAYDTQGLHGLIDALSVLELDETANQSACVTSIEFVKARIAAMPPTISELQYEILNYLITEGPESLIGLVHQIRGDVGVALRELVDDMGLVRSEPVDEDPGYPDYHAEQVPAMAAMKRYAGARMDENLRDVCLPSPAASK